MLAFDVGFIGKKAEGRGQRAEGEEMAEERRKKGKKLIASLLNFFILPPELLDS
jgi:hypothetical protein